MAFVVSIRKLVLDRSGSRMLVGDAVRLLFPQGNLDWWVDLKSKMENKEAFGPKGDQYGPWYLPPVDPIDLFAITAFLLSRSGAYHHIQPETHQGPPAEFRKLEVTLSDRQHWVEIGRAWAQATVRQDVSGDKVTLETPEAVGQMWSRIWAAFDEPLFNALDARAEPPGWWRDAVGLLAIADEAATDVGFLANEELQEATPPLLTLAVEFRILAAMKELTDGEGRGAYTLSQAAPDVACVLPKSRTPSRGCTVRSLSHNLSLLPPRGLARARWLAPVGEYTASQAQSPLNLLIIPYPFSIAAKSFHVAGLSESDARAPWGWFGVEPLNAKAQESQLLGLVDALIEEARRDVGQVHGVIFPELALSGATYAKLITQLEKHDDIEFVASGLHSDGEGRAGNFAAATIIPVRKKGQRTRRWVEDVRQKHHRWRLDADQIKSYALGSVLDPGMGWWERLDVLSRSLTVGVLRGETTITTLICEDLARVDPAQELLRAIGPNIVIALLMDSAQLQTRWPNRYATVLAEDPGSSVLTFTSLGLIERANRTGFFPPSRCIALWRDDCGVRELSLPGDSQALCLTLNPFRITESTLDGRTDSRNALSWRLGGVQPVRTDAELPEW